MRTCSFRCHHVSKSLLVLFGTCFPQFNALLLRFAAVSIQKSLDSRIPHHFRLSVLLGPGMWRGRLFHISCGQRLVSRCSFGSGSFACWSCAFYCAISCFCLNCSVYGLLAFPTCKATTYHRTFVVLSDFFRAKNAVSSFCLWFLQASLVQRDVEKKALGAVLGNGSCVSTTQLLATVSAAAGFVWRWFTRCW